MNEIFGATGSNTQLDLLVDAYRKTQQTKIDSLNERRTQLQSRDSFYGTLRSRLDSLISQIDKFKASDALSKFQAKAVASTDSSVVTATATGSALLSSSTLKVNQLASNDLLISSRVSLADSFGEVAGTQTFDITVGSSTKQISVTFDGTETNEQAMKKIVQAINGTSEINVSASFVKDTTSTGRLTLASKNSGSENKIVFSSSTALTKLGLDPTALNSSNSVRVASTDTTAGYKTANVDGLDSKFELNGINITRSTNTISDVLEGVTLNLLKVQESGSNPVILSTSVNNSSVENFVKELLTSFNDVISNISNNRDARRNDSSLSGLVQTMKNIALNKFGDTSSGDTKYLTDLGIKFDKSGFLVISDSEQFKKSLIEDPSKVADMFIGANGFAKQLESVITPYAGSTGLVATRKSSLQTQLDTTNKRISETEERVELQANSLKKQYQSYLKLFYQAQNQSTYLSGFADMSSGLA